MSVAQWLESLGLAQYADAFAENEITLEVLPTLTDADLRELGVNALGHRKKLLAAIANFDGPAETEAMVEDVKADEPEQFDPAKPAKLFIPPPSSVTNESPTPRRSASPTRRVGVTPAAQPSSRPPQLSFWARLFASKFLFISILVHLVGGTGAAYIIVQHYTAKRKVTFQGGPPTESASKRALEHSVSVAKKKSGGAPPQAKRIATAGLANISLPEMPQLPSANFVVPQMAAGIGGMGFGTGMGIGSGAGSGMGSGMGLGGGTGLGVKMLPPALACRCSVHERLAKLNQAGGSAEVEPAVTRSLEWLKSKQNADGTWGSSFKAGMTGFALLCYFGRCATPDDPQYGEVVKKGVLALIEMSKRDESGLIATNGPTQQAIYEHGIATYALGEMIALAPLSKTELPGLKQAFERGVKFIVSRQRPDGGWVYLTAVEETKGSDLSVTGWQFQALKAAKMNDLHLDGLKPAIDRVVDFMKSKQTAKSGNASATVGGFGAADMAKSYNQWALTGVGVLALQTLAKSGNYQPIQRGLGFANANFRATPPNWETNCDLYGWYYYSQAYFQEGGKDWQTWNATAMAQVLANQNPDGTWKPQGTVKHHAPPFTASNDTEIYRTCLCTLILEVYYRYLKVG